MEVDVSDSVVVEVVSMVEVMVVTHGRKNLSSSDVGGEAEVKLLDPSRKNVRK